MAVILIVDDSPTELHLFKNILEKGGFDTLVADSGEEGLRQAAAGDDRTSPANTPADADLTRFERDPFVSQELPPGYPDNPSQEPSERSLQKLASCLSSHHRYPFFLKILNPGSFGSTT